LLRRILVPLLKIIFSIVLISYLFLKIGTQDIIQRFISANIWWILLGMITFTLSNLLGAIQWYFLLKARGIHLPLVRVIASYYVGLFFNNFLIGYIGGDAIRIYDIKKASGDSANAISTVFFDRLIGFAMLTSLAMLSLLVWRNIFHSSTLILVIVSIFLCWVLSFVLIFNAKVARKIGWIFRFIFPARINDKIRNIYTSINSFKDAKKTLMSVILISLFVQSLRIVVHYFSALSVSLNPHIKYFIIFVPIVALMSSLPISIGGIGIRESSAVVLFSQIKTFQLESVVAFEFLAYLIGLIATIPGGLFFILRKEKISLKDKAEELP